MLQDLLPLVQKAEVVLWVHTSHINVLYSYFFIYFDNSLILYWVGRDISQQYSARSIKYIYHIGNSVVLTVQQ